ncbi:MAG: hypothetical protein HY293_15660 [Planctomycetes bacterium]|nr:hypothetical protein [Planctomycetota bacterium]
MKLLTILLLAALPVQETRNAEDLFKESLAKAKESKKKVFLTFGSPG